MLIAKLALVAVPLAAERLVERQRLGPGLALWSPDNADQARRPGLRAELA